jgi:hypothetical protein
MVKCYGDAATVGMSVQSVRSRLAVENEAVTSERPDYRARREGTEQSVIDPHRSDGDSDARLRENLY